jgi:hypothetical protein
MANFGSACKKFGGLGPLVWEEIENAPTCTVVKVFFVTNEKI